MSAARIIVGGDVAALGRNAATLMRQDQDELLGDLHHVLASADLVAINLETPLCRTPEPTLKSGPSLVASPECARGLVFADVIGLANNHIMDGGATGLRQTIKSLRGEGIMTVGAGGDLEQAAKPLICTVGDLRVGFIAMAEHEFGIASVGTPGANPLSFARFEATVRRRADQWDFLIVLLHAGIEHYQLPSPALQERCRFLVRLGADAVICQHSHCPGTFEVYESAPIFYGQGNFLFDLPAMALPLWHQGYLVSLEVTAPAKCQMEVLPFRQSVGGPGVSALSRSEAAAFIRELEELSRRIADPTYVLEEWRRFCGPQLSKYLGFLFGGPTVFKRLNRRFSLLPRLLSSKTKATLLHAVRCESLREVLITALEESLRGPSKRGDQ